MRGEGNTANRKPHLLLDNSGAVTRVDVAEFIRRIGWNGIAAVGAYAIRQIIGAYGHAACLASGLVAIVSLYWAWSEAHDYSLLSVFLRHVIIRNTGEAVSLIAQLFNQPNPNPSFH